MTAMNAEMAVDGSVPLEPVVSPDGRWVAYAVTTLGVAGAHPVSTLWVAAANADRPPRRLTEGAAWDHRPRWAPDSASLHFLSDRAERGTSQLYRVGTDGAEPEALTGERTGERGSGRVRGRAGDKTGIRDHLPLTDGRRSALVVTDEDPRAAGAPRVWGEGEPRDRLRLLDLGTGEATAVAGLGDRSVLEVAERPGGGALAVVTESFPGGDPVHPCWELHVVDTRTGGVQGLGRTAREPSSPTWWRSGGSLHLAYLATTPPGPDGGTAVFDIAVPRTGADGEHHAGAAAEHRNLTRGATSCPTDLAQVADGPPLALFADGLDTVVHRLDPTLRRFTPLSRARGSLDSLSASGSGAVVAAVASTAHTPKDVHAGAPEDALVRLSDTRPEVARTEWGAQRRLSYRAADGLELDGLLVLPVGQDPNDGPFPLVTWAHGGPYGRYADQFVLSPFAPAQWLAHAGYAVFLPNPRGGQGHGHAFATAVVGDVGGREWTDIVSGIDLLIDQGVADPDRLGVGGWSHGGFMAAWAVGHTDRFRAAVVGAGISDWGMLAATGEVGAAEAGLTGSVGWEGPGPHPHDRVGPVSFASRIRTPVLLLHGEDDTNVPLGQAVYLHRALRWFGVENEFAVYPGEGHGVLDRGHQIDMLHRTRAWFDRWLGAPKTAQAPGRRLLEDR